MTKKNTTRCSMQINLDGQLDNIGTDIFLQNSFVTNSLRSSIKREKCHATHFKYSPYKFRLVIQQNENNS